MARTAGSHADITGPKVHDAALSLFARHGFAAVSMRQIAAEVGVQAGALYNYTPDKQSLLFSLMRAHMNELLDAYDAQSLPADPVARLEHFVRFHIGFNAVRTEAVFVSYMELRNLEPENFAVIEGMRRDYENRLEDILHAGRDAGVFAVPDTKIATLAVIAMLTGIGTWFREGGRLSLDRVTDIYCDMVRKAVASGTVT